MNLQLQLGTVCTNPESTSAGMNTGVILLLPSEVLVSICLLFTGLVGVVVTEGAGDLAGDLAGVTGTFGTTDSTTFGFLLITSDGFSSTTEDAGVLFANDFP